MSLQWKQDPRDQNEQHRTTGEVAEIMVQRAGEGIADPMEAMREMMTKLSQTMSAILDELPEHSQREVIQKIGDFSFEVFKPGAQARPRLR